MVQTVSAIVAVIAAIVAAGIAFMQVQTMRSQARAELSRDIVKTFFAPDLRHMRGELYRLSEKPFDDWSRDDHHLVEQVCARYAEIGFIAKTTRLPIYENFGGSTFAKCYQIAEPLIEYRRLRERSPGLFIYFEWLARQEYIYARRRKWWDKKSWDKLRRGTIGMTQVRHSVDFSIPSEKAIRSHRPEDNARSLQGEKSDHEAS